MRGYLGNQSRNRQKGHRNRGGGGPRHGNEGLPVDDHMMEGGEADIISPEELAASRSAMSLTVLKNKPVHELVTMAEGMGGDNPRLRAMSRTLWLRGPRR